MTEAGRAATQRGEGGPFAEARRRLEVHRRVFAEKRVLRDLYEDWYRLVVAALVPGPTVELGSGCGSLKALLPGAIASDIVACAWLDVCADALRLPFRPGSLGNLVLFDVLHHLERPADFFAEAALALRPGGRIVAIEPYISPASRLVFALFHRERVDLRADPLAGPPAPLDPGPRRDPFEANQAVATTLFWRKPRRTLERLRHFRLVSRSRMAFFGYPLSGGFERPAFAPAWLFGALRGIERALSPLAPFLAFRSMVVLERA